MTWIKTAIACGVLGFLNVTIASEIPDFSLGVQSGYQISKDQAYSYTDPKGAIVGIYGGLYFFDAWEMNIGYQYHGNLDASGTSVQVKTQLLRSTLGYNWPLWENIDIYGKIGLSYWLLDKSRQSYFIVNKDGFSPLGEVGFQYNLNSQVKIGLGYQYIDGIGDATIGEYDSHSLLLNLSYRFGHQVDDLTLPQPIINNNTYPSSNDDLISEEPIVFNFGFDSSMINIASGAFSDVYKIIKKVETNTQVSVTITGYTDSVGSESYNQQLSEKRAHAVATELQKLGLRRSQLQISGKGEQGAVADNATDEGRAMNRRVVVTISSPINQSDPNIYE
ncbi:OmpA family protein [Vibrio artabrorum]|uniref:OmpA family protein n=1 Tax=Vibrio artabrorum TaxID=446374 RepID=A0ABT8CM88_9VIBR|nr:OmpA family protein [Vibrio artabrorum]MDN3702558.1 OmpA family protein [Vibrio artabrorum]